MSSVPHYPNRDALQRGLDLYRSNMSEFVARQLRQKPGTRLPQAVIDSLADNQRLDFAAKLQENGGDVAAAIEIGFIPRLVEQNWSDLFQRRFRDARTIRNTLRTIRDLRNNLAHDTSGQDVAAGLAETGLYHISEALANINCPEQSQEVLAIRSGIQQTGPPPAVAPTLTPPAAPRSVDIRSLKAWPLVMQPNSDVAEGSFQEAEFAANLQQVYDGSAAAVYGDPREFFRRTYLTRGMKELLTAAVKRLVGKGGNPVIRSKTGFGGGKTHSLIAIYHLVNSNRSLLDLPPSPQDSRVREEVVEIMSQAGADPAAGVTAKVAVLYGPWLSEHSDRRTDAGDPLNTLWGELAWQLGGQDAYEIVGAAARSGQAPDADQLTRLFRSVGPSVILMDEIISYARNADLARVATFLQNLTEAVQHPEAGNVMLVVTLPVTEAEAGGPAGMEVLAAVESILSRVQSVLAVTETGNDEAFAVVRRRLFQEECDTAAREETCQAFYRMYQRNSGDYPQEARETRYLERLRQCYPIHPEIFDRLYRDWSVYHEFQRTRGVLRLMAQAISRLYADGDDAPMIMPASLPFADARVSDAFLRLLGPQWNAVMGEVDQENSRAHQIDLSQPARFGGAVGGAARRVARATFLGSSTRKAIRGLDLREVNLGVVVPGHGAAAYRDAVREMDGKLYYFYRGDDRYYFDAQENLNKLVNDRAMELPDEARDREIRRRLHEFRSLNSSQVVILLGPETQPEVADSDFVRLVILGPDRPRPSRATDGDKAKEAVQRIMTAAGSIRRTKPNTLLFLAAASDQVRELRSKAARYLAWDSVLNGDRRIPNLGERRAEVNRQVTAADRELQEALVSAYRWALAPTQPDPLKAEYDTDNWRQINPDDDIAANALNHFVQQGQLVDTLSPAVLNAQLDAYIWKGPNPREHITVDELWDVLTAQVYLGLRLRNRQALEQCLRAGIAGGIFGRADGYDAAAGEYRNPRIGETPGVYQTAPLTGATLIMPGAKAAALQTTAIPPVAPGLDEPGRQPAENAEAGPPRGGSPAGAAPRRFTARKTVAHQEVAAYDFNQLREEIARVLAANGGAVTVEIVITGRKEDGFSENVARSLRDNSNMLGVDLDTE